MSPLLCSVDVDRPAEAVHTQWSRLETLAEVMPSVIEIRRLDRGRSHWVVRIRGEQRTFDAVTTEVIDGARIAWKAEGEAVHAGVVDFHRLGPSRTRVTLQLDWEPGGLFDQLGARAGIVARAVRRDLESFARHVEAAAGAAPTAPEDGSEDHRADHPADIPSPGHLEVLKRTVKQVKRDNVPVVAGGVAFFSFLALIPALAAVVSVYGLVADPEDVERQFESFFSALPDEAAGLLRTQLESVTGQEGAGLGLGAVAGLLGALWSASKGAQALIAAMNIAYGEEERRKGLRLLAVRLAMTILLVLAAAGAVAGMMAIGAVAAEFGTAGQWALTIVRWPVLLFLLAAGLAAIYRYAPNRDDAEWRWVTPGATLAATFVVLGSLAFAVYVNNFGSYSETYGSLGAIVVLLLWLQVSAYVVIMGAELDAELERQTAHDTTVGADAPMGERDAYAADTVAA